MVEVLAWTSLFIFTSLINYLISTLRGVHLYVVPVCIAFAKRFPEISKGTM
jgi:hypothetical protein